MNRAPGSLTAFPMGAGGACAPADSAVSVPGLITNAPGLSAIRYRIGTFTGFRRAMLDAIANPDLMASGSTSLRQPLSSSEQAISLVDSRILESGLPPFRVKIGSEYLMVTGQLSQNEWTVHRGSGAANHAVGDAVLLAPPNPFENWREGLDSDYQTIFVELWAYLADVLTFYQERIANEAFLGSATQRDSLLRLVNLIDYHPSPGAAAATFAAFTVAAGHTLSIPANFRVGSKARPGKPSVVFETASAITASGNLSAIPLSLFSPDVPFPKQTVVLDGIGHQIAAADYLLAVETDTTAKFSEPLLLQVDSVVTDKTSNTTTIAWHELGNQYTVASKQVAIHAFRLKAAPFGDTAPPWNALSPTLNNSDGQHPGAPYVMNWDSPSIILAGVAPIFSDNPWFYLPTPGDSGNTIFLDSAYPQIADGFAPDRWAALLTTSNVFQIFGVVESRAGARSAYSISSKSTRLTLSLPLAAFTFPLRDTTILAATEKLPVQPNLPIPGPVSGKELVLAGVHSQLHDGQQAVLTGSLFSGTISSNEPSSGQETVILDGPPRIDLVNGLTRITLKNSLSQQYIRSTCVLMANIVEITQGETVKDEVLGSGDGRALQAYPLKQKPLTYVPSTNPDGTSAVESTLNVTVNGIRWSERPNLAGSGPESQDFSTELDDSGQTTIVFGDGFNGARPPSGVGNIHARYRKGLGTSGNLAANSIQQLVDSVPDLQRVTNPMPSSGGEDPEGSDNIRVGAPGSMQSFGRAVSASDYAALALRFPGIAKASAAATVTDPATGRALAHPFLNLTVATFDRVPIRGSILAGNLRRYLDSHRDPNVPLRIQDFTPVYVAVAINIDIDPSFPQQGTLNSIRARLDGDSEGGFFAFEQQQFGRSVFLSGLYAFVQGIPGVKDATITTLRRVGPGTPEPPTTPPHDIIVRPTDIVTIDSSAFADSTLVITGQGGFTDV